MGICVVIVGIAIDNELVVDMAFDTYMLITRPLELRVVRRAQLLTSTTWFRVICGREDMSRCYLIDGINTK